MMTDVPALASHSVRATSRRSGRPAWARRGPLSNPNPKWLPMSVELSFDTPGLTEVRVTGVLLRHEVDDAKRRLHAHMTAHGPQHVLIHLEAGFGNLQAFASWDDIEEDADIQRQVVRLAIVGDLRWREAALLFVMNAVGRFRIDDFKPEEEALARAWLLHD